MKQLVTILLFAFAVQLCSAMAQTQQPEIPMPSKLFVVSDIEGELDGFQTLLSSAEITDKNNYWKFGKGHLVICGGLVDRGPKVFELIEFLMRLEKDASVKGGYVHVILGNHDIMNLSGDYRYVNKRYFDETTRKPRQSYLDSIAKGSAIGDWLRSKNIIEKLGNMLFLHAGISPEILNLGYSIDELNEACRPFYDVKQKELPPDRKMLFGANSPFWYRGYFMNPKASTALVDSTLKEYDVKYIVVGHTILKRNIASYYGGKVIGIDVDRHKGENYGLFYQKGKWTIADKTGHRIPLKYKPENDVISDKDIE